MEETTKREICIAHISDIHVGSNYFVPNLLQRTIVELNELMPDAVIITGDLTDEGFKHQYNLVNSYLSKLKCQNICVVPGNHDSRNVGYLHFEELIGPRHSVLQLPGVTIVSADSSEPDLDSGRIGREWYGWLSDNFSKADGFKIMALHHHVLPVPATGRERNIAYDAGDVLEVLIKESVDLVLTGHKHVPYVWRLENLVVSSAGTTSSLRLRGNTKPCYNLIYISDDKVSIVLKYAFGEKETILEFSKSEQKYQKWINFLDRDILTSKE
jgi:3',5'-cyclic AMP phosphodiesterase CpdA